MCYNSHGSRLQALGSRNYIQGMTGFDGEYFEMTVKAYLYDKQKILTADLKASVLAKLDRIMAETAPQAAFAYAV